MRISPTPADFKVISQPGMFTGWRLSVQLDGTVHSIGVLRNDEPHELAKQLRRLADQIDA